MSGITRNAKVFVNSIFELMRTVEVSEEKITEMQPKLVELVEDFTQRLDQVDKEISGQKDIISALIQRIAGLEKKMKRAVVAERRRDFNLVRNNIIAKTGKGVADVQRFISNAVELGGGGKVAMKNIHVVEIPSAPGKEKRDQKIYRVALGEGQKKGLFSGLARAGLAAEENTTRIDNETPAFLVNTKRQMERISYTLRSKFKDSHKLKVKIQLSGLKMRIKLKNKDSPADWFGLDDAKADDYMKENVIFGAEEIPSGGIPTVKQFYTRILEDLE